MATVDYSATRTRADGMLFKYGTTATVKVKTGQTHTSGRVTPTFETYSSVKVVILPAAEGQKEFGEGFMAGAAVDRAVRLLLVSASGFSDDPGIGSIVVIGDDEWAVTWRVEYAPDGSTNILYALRVER